MPGYNVGIQILPQGSYRSKGKIGSGMCAPARVHVCVYVCVCICILSFWPNVLWHLFSRFCVIHLIESKSIFVGPEKCHYVALVFESVLLDMEILVDGIFFFPILAH